MSLLSIITDIRQKSGVGGKPMLGELADAIADRIATVEREAREDERKRCAEIAYLEALKAGRRERRTKTLRLFRETYPHEYGCEIRDAILHSQDTPT